MASSVSFVPDAVRAQESQDTAHFRRICVLVIGMNEACHYQLTHWNVLWGRNVLLPQPYHPWGLASFLQDKVTPNWLCSVFLEVKQHT